MVTKLEKILLILKKCFIVWFIFGILFTGLYKTQKIEKVNDNMPKEVKEFLWGNFKKG